MGKQIQPPEQDGWQEASDHALRLGLAATPEQRVAWLEEMLKLVQRMGLLRSRHDDWGRELE